MSSTALKLKSYLSPDEYRVIAKRTLLVSLTPDEFYVLLGQDKILELINDFDQKTDFGRNALPQNGERGISFADLKKIVEAHSILDHFPSIEDAQKYVESEPTAEISEAIQVVRNCIRIKAMFASKVVLHHG